MIWGIMSPSASNIKTLMHIIYLCKRLEGTEAQIIIVPCKKQTSYSKKKVLNFFMKFINIRKRNKRYMSNMYIEEEIYYSK